jgi:hypothetical protein
MDLSLPLTQLTQTLCGFRGCQSNITPDNPFKMCEVCRTIVVTEKLTLLVDPFHNYESKHKDKFLNEAIVSQTAAEVLQTRANLEYLYLEYSKVIKLYGIEPSSKKAKQTVQEEIDEARTLNKNVETRSLANKKKAKEVLSKLQKQMKAIGCKDPARKTGACVDCNHEKEAKRIFNDELAGDVGF